MRQRRKVRGVPPIVHVRAHFIIIIMINFTISNCIPIKVSTRSDGRNQHAGKQAGQVADAVSLKVQRVLVPERPQTARPSSQRRPDTGGGRPQRPSTSRPDARVGTHVASRPPSARTTSGATPRPSTANSRMSAGAADADGSESARALSLVTARPGSARVPYTKKPISHTPTVPPPA